MRTVQLLFAALCFDWLALSVARLTGFLRASWLVIAALPIYALLLGVLAVFAALVIAFLFLTARAVLTQNNKGKSPTWHH